MTVSHLHGSGRPMFDIVIPTVGRPSLHTLLTALGELAGDGGVPPASIVLADDRPLSTAPITGLDCVPRPVIVRVGGRGPAAARNAGWRRCAAPWVVFLDDDVVPEAGWLRALAGDLADCPPWVAAVQGRLDVPLPADRPPTDYERNVAKLESSAWITADMAVRRRALLEVGGFDERFRRAYREDTDLAMRLADAGWELRVGRRRVNHPVRASSWRTSVSAQRGNADDALMARLHGPNWRSAGRAPAGALRSHVATVSMAAITATAVLARRPRTARWAAAATSALIARFWLRRAAVGPKQSRELLGLAASSALIPFAATYWAVAGRVRARSLAPRGRRDRWTSRPPALVLFDRDGTLIHDVPYNGDPSLIELVDGARAALDRLRRAGVAVGMITNQSGIGRGLLTHRQVVAMNGRIEQLLGPFSVIRVCPHVDRDRCRCRKPAPGMVLDAASTLGIEPDRCAVVGDIGSDVLAGVSAGARAVLVPNPATEADEIVAAPEVADSLAHAVDLLIGTAGGVR